MSNQHLRNVLFPSDQRTFSNSIPWSKNPCTTPHSTSASARLLYEKEVEVEVEEEEEEEEEKEEESKVLTPELSYCLIKYESSESFTSFSISLFSPTFSSFIPWSASPSFDFSKTFSPR